MNTLAQPQENFNTVTLPNGPKYRCCGCLAWADELGAIGVWVPDRTKPFAIRYPICPRCADFVQRGGKKAKRVANTAEAYLRDRLKESETVGE